MNTFRVRWLVASAALAVIGCVSLSRSSSRQPAGGNYDVMTSKFFDLRAPVFPPTRVNLGRAMTPELFIAQLPSHVRESYTLVHTSCSLHDASHEEPRVIASDVIADTVYSWNGSLDQAGGAAIEAISYNYQTEAYDFHEFDYSGAKVVHRVNDQRCQACHSTANAPLWSGYADWRGSYGANHEIFGQRSRDVLDRDGYENVEYVSAREDQKALANFVSRQDRNPRYALLVRPPGEKLWPLSASAVASDTVTDEFDFGPNRRLGIGLRFHQARSNAARFAKTRLFRDYPAHVLYKLLSCENTPSATPLYDEWFGRIKDAASAAGLQAGSTSVWDVAGLVPLSWGLNDRKRIKRPTPDEFVDMGFLENGLPPRLEGMALWPRYAARVGARMAFAPLDEHVASRMGVPLAYAQRLNQVIPIITEDDQMYRLCPEIKTRMATERASNVPIAAELKPEQRAELLDHAAGKPYVLRQCIVCHTDQNFAGAPQIPFDRPALMANLLRRPATTSTRTLFDEIRARTEYTAPDDFRMPKGAYGLPKAEQTQLLEYLRAMH